MIEELDEKKKAALKATWLKVNTDFGAIFSTLLPGAHAKLEPPEGESYLDGEGGGGGALCCVAVGLRPGIYAMMQHVQAWILALP